MSSKGLFISLEGGEGSGKSTQVKLLERRLKAKGYKVVIVREPGSTRISEAIREITHSTKNKKMGYKTEALLFAAARAQGLIEVYLPALEKGAVLIADRYVDSSYAYQGFGRGLGLELVKAINDFATDSLMPVVTFWLDIDRKIGHTRRHGTAKVDRMDIQGEEFYKKVEDGYKKLSKLYPDRIVKIDASKAPEVIHEQLYEKVLSLLKPVK